MADLSKNADHVVVTAVTTYKAGVQLVDLLIVW